LWHYLYSKLGKTEESVDEQALEKVNANSNEKGKDKTQETVDRIVAMAKVLFGLHMVSILGFECPNKDMVLQILHKHHNFV